MINVNIKKLDERAIVPKYATDGSGCFDIHTYDTGKVLEFNSKAFSTGLAFEIPDGYVMLVFSRSGHGFKNDVRLANCVGVIDSDFRGQLMVKLTADAEGGLSVESGDRIAQAFIIPYPKVNFIEVEELSGTVRGTGGLGSTGSK